MKFTYQPSGVEDDAAKVWIVKTEKLLNTEAEVIEKVTGLRFPEWTTELQNGRMSAVHALLWVLLKRETPTLAYEAVSFAWDDYELDFDDDEKLEILKEIDASVEAGTVLNEGEQVARDEMFAAVGHLLVADEPEPEAPEPTFDDEVAEAPKGSAVSLVS